MLHRFGSPQALGLARIVVFGIWLGSIAFAPVALYAELPSELLQPTGIFRRLPMWEDVLTLAVDRQLLVALKLVEDVPVVVELR